MKVACYCRVSTDHNDQVNSFQSQQRYFRTYAAGIPEWELYEIYADEGISGTGIKQRIGFQRMISDAMAGKFQLILTKEVSRFSRNILDTISYTRRLKEAGVSVMFLTDGIHTADPDAELRLSIMASIAQEESRRTSARVKWGQTRQMERGVVFGHSLLGYTVSNGVLSVEPEGAALVKLIFHKYGREGKGSAAIARELEADGYGQWNSSRIIKILRNEKYVGDLMQKKTFTPDYLTHTRRTNHGEESFILLKDHHEPIISRALWDAVQQELHRRSKHAPRKCGCSAQYLLSGKIRCGECGGAFVCRQKTHKDGSVLLRWRCAAAHGSQGCKIGRLLRNDDALDMLQQAFDSLILDREALIYEVLSRVPENDEYGQAARLNNKLSAVMDAYFSGRITQDEMCHWKAHYENSLYRLRQAHQPVHREAAEEALRDILANQLQTQALYRSILGEITVYADRPIELRFSGLSKVFYFYHHMI